MSNFKISLLVMAMVVTSMLARGADRPGEIPFKKDLSTIPIHISRLDSLGLCRLGAKRARETNASGAEETIESAICAGFHFRRSSCGAG